MRAHVRAGVALFVAFFATAGLTSASTVGIVPTRLAIARAGTSVDLTIENGGAETTGYSVRAFRWHQQPGGQVALAPTDELIVYPQRLMLGPFERRPIRIGFTGALQATEQDFRIIVTENASSSDGTVPGTVLTVRSKVSVPLFVAPDVARIAADVRDATASAARLTFALAASGSVHVFATRLIVRGEDANGAQIFSTSLDGWYVLPGEPRIYDVPLAAAVCSRLRRVSIDATFDAAPPLHATVEPSRTC